MKLLRSLWEFLTVRLKHHFIKDSTMFFKVNTSAILLQREWISIIKSMTVLFFILLHLAHSFTACAKTPRIHNNNRTQHSWKNASKCREIAGPAVALPCISHCHQGDTLQCQHSSMAVTLITTSTLEELVFQGIVPIPTAPCHFIFTISILQTCSSQSKPG